MWWCWLSWLWYDADNDDEDDDDEDHTRMGYRGMPWINSGWSADYATQDKVDATITEDDEDDNCDDNDDGDDGDDCDESVMMTMMMMVMTDYERAPQSLRWVMMMIGRC